MDSDNLDMFTQYLELILIDFRIVFHKTANMNIIYSLFTIDLNKNPTQRVGLEQSGPHHHLN
jgi:hypothetical protein